MTVTLPTRNTSERVPSHPSHKTGNTLLVQIDDGQTRRCVGELPVDEFTYGKRVGVDPHGVKACMSWSVSKPTSTNKYDIPDFDKINKAAIHTKQGDSGKQPTLAHRFNAEKRRKQQKLNNDRPRQDVCYGKRSKEPGDINAVLKGEYEKEGVERLEKAYAEIAEYKEAQSQPIKTRFTKAALGHGAKAWAVEEEKEIFKLSKFEKVSRKVDTNRHALQGLNL